MLNLVKKDLKLSRRNINIFGLIYALFIAVMGLMMPDHPVANILYILGIITLIFILVIYINRYDDKYKSEIIFNSFPIDRRDIVRGKYISLIIYAIIACSAILIFTNSILRLGIITNGRSANIWDGVFAISISLIFYSIYYPFYFKLGEGIRSFNTILWILMVAGPKIITKSIEKLEEIGYLEKILSIDINRISIYLFIFSLIMFYISLQISKKIYMRKEF